MGLVDSIKALCTGKNTNFAALERDLDFGQGTVRKWDVSSPSVDKLQKVADYFDVSLDALLGRENEKSPGDDPELKDIDFAFFHGDYKDLTDADKDMLREMARRLRERGK